MPKDKITFHTAYSKKQRVQLSFPPGEGRTKQEFKAEADINVIMKRYERTGVIEYVQKRSPQYADVTGRDYQEAMNLIADARTAFEELPATMRARFDNDPAELLDFIADEANREEAADLGLLTPEATAKVKAAKAAAASPPAPLGAPAPAPQPAPAATVAAATQSPPAAPQKP